jgi:hypothetical protein
MAQSRKQLGTPITLRGGAEVGIPGDLVSLVRASSTTVARTRIAGEPRDVVYCWDDALGTVLWTGGVRFDSEIPAVAPERNALHGTGGCEIALPSTLITFVELNPGEYVVCWEPKNIDDKNVACFNANCELEWKIGDAPGHPPWAYHSVALRPGDRLEAYAKSRGYLSVVDWRTGAVGTTAPYR